MCEILKYEEVPKKKTVEYILQCFTISKLKYKKRAYDF